MVPPAGTPLRADRLRALNAPQPVTVELDAEGNPVAVAIQEKGRLSVETLGESWRIDDEWWRTPISRRYVEVVLEGGRHVVVFEDLSTGEWWMQTP